MKNRLCKSRRTQMSIEFIVVIAFITVALMPIFYYSTAETSTSLKISKAQDAVEKLANAANTVYSLGPGNKQYVTIALPSGIEGTFINGTEITLKLRVKGALTDISKMTKAIVTGSFSPTPGDHHFLVEALETGVVIIGEDVNPPIVIATSPSGKINDSKPVMSATTDENALCKYDTADKSYSGMLNSFVGSDRQHTAQLNPLLDGNYTFYVKCIDGVGNEMVTSAIIQFEIVTAGDPNAPVVTNVNDNPDPVCKGRDVMFSATVTDPNSLPTSFLVCKDASCTNCSYNVSTTNKYNSVKTAASTYYEYSSSYNCNPSSWCAIINYDGGSEYEGELSFSLYNISGTIDKAEVCSYVYYLSGNPVQYIEKISSASCSYSPSITGVGSGWASSTSITGTYQWKCVNVTNYVQQSVDNKEANLYLRWWGQDANYQYSPYACFYGPGYSASSCGATGWQSTCAPFLNITYSTNIAATSGCYCKTDLSTATNKACNYTVKPEDNGTKDYYVKACNNADFCSDAQHYTFSSPLPIPSVSSVTDMPDSVSRLRDIEFTANVSDACNSPTSMLICKDASCNNCSLGNTSGCYCSTLLDTTTSKSCNYTVQLFDNWTKNYYARACNSMQLCSAIQGPYTFYVNEPPILTSVADSPDPVDYNKIINFSSVCSDPEGSNVKLVSCRTADCNISSTDIWCKSDTAVSSNPSCAYITSLIDGGVNNYYATCCDVNEGCSNVINGMFSVNAPPPNATRVYTSDVAACYYGNMAYWGYYYTMTDWSGSYDYGGTMCFNISQLYSGNKEVFIKNTTLNLYNSYLYSSYQSSDPSYFYVESAKNCAKTNSYSQTGVPSGYNLSKYPQPLYSTGWKTFEFTLLTQEVVAGKRNNFCFEHLGEDVGSNVGYRQYTYSGYNPYLGITYYIILFEKDNFDFNWSNAIFTNGGKVLDSWGTRNKGVSEITITRMRVDGWSARDSDGAVLKKIFLGNTQVWSGTATDNTWVDITDFTISAGVTYGSGNKLEFSRDVSNENERVRITFEFSDNSNYTTAYYPVKPVISAVMDSPDPVYVGSDITFSATVTDPNSLPTSSLVCKDASCNNCSLGNTSGCYCSTLLDTTTSKSCNYAVKAEDNGTKQYWARACNSVGYCSEIYGEYTSSILLPLPSISSVTDAPDPQEIGRQVNFSAYVTDPASYPTSMLICKNSNCGNCSVAATGIINTIKTATSTYYEYSSSYNCNPSSWCALINYGSGGAEYEGELTFSMFNVSGIIQRAEVCSYVYYLSGSPVQYIEKLSSASCSNAPSLTGVGSGWASSTSITGTYQWKCVDVTNYTQQAVDNKESNLYLRWWGQDLNYATSPYACFYGPGYSASSCSATGWQSTCAPYLNITYSTGETSGCYCSTSLDTTTNKLCSYITQAGGTNNYWAKACNSVQLCSAIQGPYTFTVQDIFAPAIVLNSPANNTVSSVTSMTLSYNVSDTGTLSNCKLYINSMLNKTNTTILNNQPNEFYVGGLGNGTYRWSINCTDTAGNVGASEKRVFNISTAITASNITICHESETACTYYSASGCGVLGTTTTCKGSSNGYCCRSYANSRTETIADTIGTGHSITNITWKVYSTPCYSSPNPSYVEFYLNGHLLGKSAGASPDCSCSPSPWPKWTFYYTNSANLNAWYNFNGQNTWEVKEGAGLSYNCFDWFDVNVFYT